VRDRGSSGVAKMRNAGPQCAGAPMSEIHTASGNLRNGTRCAR
jgi:hypothetical protein